MKNLASKLLAAALLLVGSAAFFSCNNDDDVKIKSYPMEVKFALNDGLAWNNITDAKLIVSNDKGLHDTISIKGDTTITFVQGQYNFVVTGKVKDEAAAYVQGTAGANLFQNATVNVALSKVVRSSLIFKAIYTTGGKQGYMKDGYFEIVNNSDEVQYLDGLILSAPAGKQQNKNAWQANGFEDLYACGQGQVLAFPGSGHDYPLQPGQSVLIANDGANHKDLAGAGNHCPDLSKADWEVYLSYVNGEIDYPAKNLDVIFVNNKYMKAFGLGFFGRAYVLARLPQGMTPEAFAADHSNIKKEPGNAAATMEYLVIPSKYVLDAVDIWDAQTTNHYPTFLAKDDAEGVLASKAWEGKCVRRKVTKVVNGRAYYQDTNNSANDFLNNQELKPGVTPAVADNQ
ncbi:MAG: DUF4876 domain-containing protein [Prevotellaceae bacterium]|jgi:putative lipoprotein|nr:DUF4876 domain-containing protein [Prevotellaceae bacterium]